MVTNLGGNKYEVGGIVPLGAAYIFVRDKSINSIEKAAGKNLRYWVVMMHKNYGSTCMSAQAVLSDISNFAAKFNNGQM